MAGQLANGVKDLVTERPGHGVEQQQEEEDGECEEEQAQAGELVVSPGQKAEDSEGPEKPGQAGVGTAGEGSPHTRSRDLVLLALLRHVVHTKIYILHRDRNTHSVEHSNINTLLFLFI